MGITLEISAKEARKLTEQSTFILNVFYKNIKNNAEKGCSTFVYTYMGEEDWTLLSSVIDHLKNIGYNVVTYMDTDEQRGNSYGEIVVSW